MNQSELVSRILELKKQRDAVILVHNYQRPEVQDIADCLGDSLDLARRATTIDHPVIVFCGVHFMAESTSMLCPNKTVLLPREDAGCPLADCATPEQVRAMRARHPDAVFIAYINTSAAVKAECDVCATSANALRIIGHFPDRDIVYLPDRNLADYAERMLNRTIIKWPGQCYVHDRLITVEAVEAVKRQVPGACVMAHPEAPRSVLEHAHVITGTNGMVREAGTNPATDFIVVTETGLVHRLRKEHPEKRFHEIPGAVCSNMKLTSLRSVHDALRDMQTRITVDPSIASRARIPLDRMLELSR